MSSSSAEDRSTTGRLARQALAALVLLIIAWIVIKVVIGIVAALFIPILLIAAVIAGIWAFRVLF